MIENSKRIVFKFGTNILRNEDGEISLSHLYSFIEDITHLYKQGKEILIVTSGAVGLGAKKLKIDTSTSTTLKQAAASVGQPLLMGIWQDGFEKYGITTSAAIAKKAIPTCNLCFITENEMKTNVNGYFTVLFNANPKSIGGKMPADDFYYNAE